MSTTEISSVFEELISKKKSLAIIGLGYVGLPIALAFAKKIRVIGFDTNEQKIESYQKGIDPSEEVNTALFDDCDLVFTSDIEKLKEAVFFIIAVPTPIFQSTVPDLRILLSATQMLAQVLKKGDVVVYESTVYPGCTEEECIPILEKGSNLQFNRDFKVGYSPERINPGDKEHTLAKITKIVSGSCDASLDLIAKVYGLVVEAGIFKASSIKVAEAAKVIENTQRDLNIALMNELSKIFNQLGLNTYEVLEAAGTKWNFLKFTPGLVGGHCIGVDPYYLTYKARQMGYHPQVILSGRRINDSMGSYIAQETVKLMLNKKSKNNDFKALVMGITFKENVKDIRNSKSVDLVKELLSFNVSVDITDLYADEEELQHEYNLQLINSDNLSSKKYDAVIVTVKHEEYINLNEDYFRSISQPNGILIDIKGIYRNKIKQMTYWSL